MKTGGLFWSDVVGICVSPREVIHFLPLHRPRVRLQALGQRRGSRLRRQLRLDVEASPRRPITYRAPPYILFAILYTDKQGVV